MPIHEPLPKDIMICQCKKKQPPMYERPQQCLQQPDPSTHQSINIIINNNTFTSNQST